MSWPRLLQSGSYWQASLFRFLCRTKREKESLLFHLLLCHKCHSYYQLVTIPTQRHSFSQVEDSLGRESGWFLLNNLLLYYRVAFNGDPIGCKCIVDLSLNLYGCWEGSWELENSTCVCTCGEGHWAMMVAMASSYVVSGSPAATWDGTKC